MGFFSGLGRVFRGIGGFAGGLLGASSGAVNSPFGQMLGNAWLQHRENKSVFYRNARMSWDMWNAQNAYNTPSAQMQRYREAGLNPNLIYGQSNAAGPISVPSMAPSRYSMSDVTSRMALDNMSAQSDLMRQQALTLANRRNLDNSDFLLRSRAALDAHNNSVLNNQIINRDIRWLEDRGYSRIGLQSLGQSPLNRLGNVVADYLMPSFSRKVSGASSARSSSTGSDDTYDPLGQMYMIW